MLPPSNKEPVSLLRALSARKSNNSSVVGRKQQDESSVSKVNTTRQQKLGSAACGRPTFRRSLPRKPSESEFQSLTTSGKGFVQGSLNGETRFLPTSSIVNQALEVMRNSMNESSIPSSHSSLCDRGNVDSDSSKEDLHTDESTSISDQEHDNSDESNENDKEQTRSGNPLSAQVSFRKIAKKRRKAGGQSSFHHTKSSKEYLRKAQEAYEKLRISEQRQQNEEDPASLTASESSTEEESNPYEYEDPDATENSQKDANEIDYGYGNPAESQPEKSDGQTYTRASECHPLKTVDYGYGDTDSLQKQAPRREGRARRRNSVTKYSIQAANVVAAKEAAQRILKLKPSLASLSRGRSSSPTKKRDQLKQTLPRFSTRGRSSTPSRRMDAQKSAFAALSRGRSSTPTRTRRRDHEAHGSNRTAAMRTTLEKEQEVKRNPNMLSENVRSSAKAISSTGESSSRRNLDSIRSECNESSTSTQTISASVNLHLNVTSEYFTSDSKQKKFYRRNSGRLNGMALRFNTPLRTESWLSHDNSYSTMNNNEDDDADSLASDLESLCSIRDNSHRLETSHNNLSFKSTDVASVQPTPPLGSPHVQASPSLTKSRLTSPDHLTRFSGGTGRKSLVITWSSGSNKDGSLSRCVAEKVRTARENSGAAGKYPILPFPANVKAAKDSNSCMPAPLNRTPSYKSSDNRQV